MRAEGVAAAIRELKRAGRAAKRVTSFEAFEDAEDAWAEFLNHSNRVYIKLRAACHGQGVDWTWWKKKMDERRDEPLLAYVHHARNSDTHRLEETTERLSAGRHVVDTPGIGPLHYSAPDHLRALPVIDSRVVYPVPTEFRDFTLFYAEVGPHLLTDPDAPSGLGCRGGFAPSLILDLGAERSLRQSARKD